MNGDSMTNEILYKIDEFLRNELMKLADYYNKDVRGAYYRIEHSYRVAYNMKEIAKKEGFDEDKAFVAGLFHDIGYSIDYSNKDANEHGRDGARIARPFLISLGFDKKDVEEICYGIARHVDGKSDFEHEPTILALSVWDADNIDRWDAFRLYEGLHNSRYKDLSINEQKEFVLQKIKTLKEEGTYKCSTPTAQKIWEEKIEYQIEFYNRLLNQVNKSK